VVVVVMVVAVVVVVVAVAAAAESNRLIGHQNLIKIMYTVFFWCLERF